MLTQQSITNFIGRLTEIGIFKQWLTDKRPGAPCILYFHDKLEAQEKKGGAGKTWLLRRCMQIAEEQHLSHAVVIIDFFDVNFRDGVATATRIVEALTQAFPQWAATNFTEVLESYLASTGMERQESTEQRAALYRALTTDLKKLDQQLTDTTVPLLVMFDTAEIIEKTPSIAVLSFSHLFPDNYQFNRIKFVIASRDKIDWTQPNWQGREKEVREVAVKPFSQQEMIAYLTLESIYDPDTQPELVKALYERTEGRPIMVGLVADVLNNHVVTVEDLVTVAPASFEPYLVPQIQQLENPTNWVILFMAHVYHRFNSEMLHWILSTSSLKDTVRDLSSDALINQLPSLSFVRTFASGNYLVLHDEMRRLVNKYCWRPQDPDRAIRREISQRMIEYFDKQTNVQSLSDQERQTYTVEKLFHMLFLNLDDGLKYFASEFSSALDLLKRTFARTLLQEVFMFREDMNAITQQNLQLDEAKLLRIEEDPAAALLIYQQLEEKADPQWLLEHKSQIYLERGECYDLQNKFTDAIASMEHSLKIEQEHGNDHQVGTILNKLGVVFRKLGQFNKAQEYYERGLALYAKLDNQIEYAKMINNLSNIDRLRGKTQQALRHCRIGLNIRKSLFQAGKGSEYHIGLSQSTLGLIYLDAGHFVWGGQQFEQAYEIFIRLGRKQELAQVYNRFGQIALARRQYEEARNWLKQAEEASAEINMEAYINSLNKQGRLALEQQQWSEAAMFFARSVSKAKEIHDDYQLAENLIDQAQAFHYLDDHEAEEKAQKEASAISQQWYYYDLLGRIEQFLGDNFYAQGDYKTAFIHYREYCLYMAIRNEVEYNKALTVVIDNLYAVPGDEATAIINNFVAYWSQKNMDKNYPELATTLQDISKAKFLEKLPDVNSPLSDT
jgi:tetratricopeptide (TPR) repeat protein